MRDRSINIFALCAAMLFLLSLQACVDSSQDDCYENGAEIHEKEAVFVDVSVQNIVKHRESIDPLNGADKRLAVREMSLSRTMGQLRFCCELSNGVDSCGVGGAFLIGPNVLMTADHNITDFFSGVCKSNPTITGAVLFAKDVNSSPDTPLIPNSNLNNNRYYDDNPPNIWMLRNRIESLSLREAGFVVEPISMIPSGIPSPSELSTFYEDSFTIGALSSNFVVLNSANFGGKDIAIILISDIEVKSGQNVVNIPFGVFYDWAEIYKQNKFVNEFNVNDLSTARTSLTQVHIDVNLPLYESNWLRSFTPNGQRSIYSAPDMLFGEFSIIIDREGSIKAPNYTLPCNGYASNCFPSTADAAKGTSGSPLWIQYGADYVLAGIAQSGPSVPNLEDFDPHYPTPPYPPGYDIDSNGYFSDQQSNILTYNKFTTFTSVELNKIPVPTLDDTNPPIHGKIESEGQESNPVQRTGCVGNGCSNPNMIQVASCANAYGLGNYENLPVSNALGVVGSPVSIPIRSLHLPGNNLPPDNIDGLGTFGLVCNNWSKLPYTDQWHNIKVVGYNKTESSLVDSLLSGNSLMRNIQYNALEYINASPNSNNPLKQIHSPLPFKTCPPHQVLTAIEINENSSGEVLGVSKIECTDITNVTKTSIYSLTSRSEFEQFVGDPYPTNSPKWIKCNKPLSSTDRDKSVVTGFEYFRDGSDSDWNKNPLGGIRLVCDRRYFQ